MTAMDEEVGRLPEFEPRPQGRPFYLKTGEQVRHVFFRVGLDRPFATVGAAFDGKGLRQGVVVTVMMDDAIVGDFQVMRP